MVRPGLLDYVSCPQSTRGRTAPHPPLAAPCGRQETFRRRIAPLRLRRSQRGCAMRRGLDLVIGLCIMVGLALALVLAVVGLAK